MKTQKPHSSMLWLTFSEGRRGPRGGAGTAPPARAPSGAQGPPAPRKMCDLTFFSLSIRGRRNPGPDGMSFSGEFVEFRAVALGGNPALQSVRGFRVFLLSLGRLIACPCRQSAIADYAPLGGAGAGGRRPAEHFNLISGPRGAAQQPRAGEGRARGADRGRRRPGPCAHTAPKRGAEGGAP